MGWYLDGTAVLVRVGGGGEGGEDLVSVAGAFGDGRGRYGGMDREGSGADGTVRKREQERRCLRQS